MDSKRARIIAYMKKNGAITQKDAIGLGSLRLASQIFALKEKGYVIATDIIDVTNADGTTSRIASYRLISEPEKEARR